MPQKNRTRNTSAMDRLLSGWVESSALAGVAAYAERGGSVLYNGRFGHAVVEESKPIREDTIFQIFSMTKPVTATAALMLYEQGLYKMHDPVSKFIPEFRNPKVYETDATGKVFARPARREIRIRDLFTMTSGIPYPGTDTPTERAMARRDRHAEKTGHDPVTLDAVRELASVPLEFDPGTRWKYGMSLDVIGALVEVWSGKTLGQYFREEIFEPLGMTDTGFFVPEADRDRLAALYPRRKDGTIADRGVNRKKYHRQPAFESGGGGLVSTIGDYAKLARMLLHSARGESGLLGRKTVDLMRRNHLTPEQAVTHNWDTQRGYGYGLAVRTMLDPAEAGISGSVGEFGWDGYAGTWFCVDPAEDLIAVFMTQRAPGGHYDIIPPFMAALYSML